MVIISSSSLSHPSESGLSQVEAPSRLPFPKVLDGDKEAMWPAVVNTSMSPGEPSEDAALLTPVLLLASRHRARSN